MKRVLSLLLFAGIFLSCEKMEKVDPVKDTIAPNYDDVSARAEFAIVLSKAVHASPSIREFIKHEALKMIDYDFDVFYPFVSNTLMNNNLTFRENILMYTDEASLSEIEKKIPLLTIYVPTLPSGFSPESWDAETEIPSVVADGISYNNEYVYFQNGLEKVKANSNLIPSFPTLVVKNNERIIISNIQSSTNSRSAAELKNSYEFISKKFDNRGQNISYDVNNVKRADFKGLSKNASSLNGVTWGPRLTSIGLTTEQLNASGLADVMVSKEAIGNTQGANNWQRDFVYYYMIPSSPKGKLRTNFKEFIHYISISESGFNLMTNTNSDPDDPILKKRFSSGSFWTDGYFELRFDVLSNSKNGQGERFSDIISVKPEQLFDIQYKKQSGFFEVEKVIPKFAKIDMPLQTWDLENVSYGWKISVSEVDQQGTSTINSTNSSKFATNFGFDAAFGPEKIKLGLKFGTSAEMASTKTHTYTVQNVSDELGDVLVEFGDHLYDRMEPVFANGSINMYYYFNTAYNSNVSLLLAPKRMY